MKQYLETIQDVIRTGDVKGDRTGTGTISKFGGMMKFPLRYGMWPLVTTRHIDPDKIAVELEWMIKGMISVQWLKDNNCNIWNSWMGEQSGTIGPMYGEQWRNWNAGVSKEEVLSEFDEEIEEQRPINDFDPKILNKMMRERLEKLFDEKTKPYEQGGRGGTDQLQYVVDELKNNPESRRICVSLWHAGLLPDTNMSPKDNADNGRMALAPCHSMWQVNTAPLSDMEILREIVPLKSDIMAYKIETLMFSESSAEPTQSLEMVRRALNQHLLEARYIAIEGPNPLPWDNETPDIKYEITELGYSAITAYKLEGRPTRKLSLLCFARSQDLPLGTAFNVAMYGLLAHQLASLTNMLPWEYTHFMGDYHVYSNQIDGVTEQLKRSPRPPARVVVDPLLEKIDDFNHKHLVIQYRYHDKIVFPRAAV